MRMIDDFAEMGGTVWVLKDERYWMRRFPTTKE
jgi:hypothetical protein